MFEMRNVAGCRCCWDFPNAVCCVIFVGDEFHGVVKLYELSDGAKFDNIFIAQISFSSPMTVQQAPFKLQSVTKIARNIVTIVVVIICCRVSLKTTVKVATRVLNSTFNYSLALKAMRTACLLTNCFAQ